LEVKTPKADLWSKQGFFYKNIHKEMDALDALGDLIF